MKFAAQHLLVATLLSTFIQQALVYSGIVWILKDGMQELKKLCFFFYTNRKHSFINSSIPSLRFHSIPLCYFSIMILMFLCFYRIFNLLWKIIFSFACRSLPKQKIAMSKDNISYFYLFSFSVF